MFRFVSALKAVRLALAAGIGLAPAVSVAAPVMLHYNFTASVTSTSYFHECYDFGDCADYEDAGFATTYQGPAVGSSGSGWLAVSFDDADPTGPGGSVSYDISFLPVTVGSPWITSYDPAGPTTSVQALDFFDLFLLTIAPTGGSGYLGYEQDDSGVDFAEIWFRIDDVIVTTPVPMAATPLPTALPLLAGGIAGLAWIGRRRARA